MDRENLQKLVDEGLSSYKIAKIVGKAPTTIRYWINRLGITRPEIQAHLRICPKCAQTKHIDEFYKGRNKKGTSVYCKYCTVQQTTERQRATKLKVLEYLGGCCSKCGYDQCVGALQIHHLDPKEKDSNFKSFKLRTFDTKFKAELDKCIILCANCHSEEHFC